MNEMNWLAIWQALGPEIVLLAAACGIAIIDLFVQHPRRTLTFWLTLLTLGAFSWMHLSAFLGGQTMYGLERMVVTDEMGHLLACFAGLAVAVALAYSQDYALERDMLKGELFTLSLFALLGCAIMISGNNFLVIYMGLELMSLSLYALVALRRDHAVATEAAMKYFVLGALASGFLLYGLSMMYGATGTLEISEVFKALVPGTVNKQVLAFGLVFIVSGLAFKLALVPFHMWVPDVYHGAPTPATLLIASAPKIAAFAVTIRILVEGLVSEAKDWQQMLMILAVASLVIGNLAAVAQTNLKRMLAYSTIAQIGFMLLGLTPTVVGESGTAFAVAGYSAAMFYLLTYVLTTLGTFGLVLFMARRGFEAEQISDLAGLNQRSPLLAGVMATLMFSLAGIPPTVGFYGKLAVLQALVATNDSLYIGLALAAVLLSLVGAFYYLRIVKVMYFDEPAAQQPALSATGGARALLSLNGAAVLGLGLFPGGLMAWCFQAIGNALST